MNVTASPMPLTINGKEYQITPLSDQSSHGVTQWLRADLMKSAWLAEQEVNKAGESGAEFAKVILQACLGVEWTDANGTAVLRTDRGLARLLVESLRPTVAGITQTMAIDLLKADGAKGEFWDVFLAVNDFEEVDDTIEKKKLDPRDNAGRALSGTAPKDGEATNGTGNANPNTTKPAGC